MSVSKRRSSPGDAGKRHAIHLSAAAVVASFVGWCGTSDAASTPQPPISPTLHGYYWKHSALILPVARDIVRSVAVEGNAGTGIPPLAAVGGPEGVVVYAFKSLPANAPPGWHKEATLLGGQGSLSGNRLAVGTPDGGGGHVQVYARSASGSWNAMGAQLYPPVQAVAEEFGRSLELDGNTLVVGLPNLATGKAYIFELQLNQWVQTAELGTETGIGVQGSHFGGTVGVSNDYVVVGQLPPNAPGVVYVYHKDGGAWSVSQTLTARDPANPTQPALAGDLQAQQFGKTFEIRDTQLAVRSNGYVQMFDREPLGNTWTYSETFSVGPTMPLLSGRDLRSIAFDGKSLLIGEPLAEKNGIVAGRVRPRLGPYSRPIFPTAYFAGASSDTSIWENPLEADVQFGKVTSVEGGWLIIGDDDHAYVYQKTAY